jgi:hypothetical protein
VRRGRAKFLSEQKFMCDQIPPGHTSKVYLNNNSHYIYRPYYSQTLVSYPHRALAIIRRSGIIKSSVIKISAYTKYGNI